MKINIRTDKWNYYYFLSLSETDKYFSIIADTNTAINLERFYYNPEKLINKSKSYTDLERNQKWSATTKILLKNIYKDPVYGFALQEACWDYEIKCINNKQYKKMEQALESQYSWSKSDIIKNAYSSGRKYIDKIERKSNKYVSTLIDQFECNPLMVSSYACVLEIMILQIKSKDKLKAYEEYVKFMNNELFGSLAIENHLAMCYFLGEGNTENLVKAIFKFGKKPLLLNAWNTCWDIFFIRLLIKSHYDSSNDIIKPVLITADNGIRDLAKAMAIETAISSGEDFLPILSFSDTGIKTEYVKIANNLEKQLYFDTLLRMEKRNKIGDLNTHLIKIISELERELIYIS